MISINSLKKFFIINTFLYTLSYLQYNTLYFFVSFKSHISSHLFFINLIFLIRNFFILQFINYGTKNKKIIHDPYTTIINYSNKKPHFYFFITTFIEALSHLFLITHFKFRTKIFKYFFTSYLSFIPISFLYELVFDFFHYITHYYSHSNKILYRYFHKKHHEFIIIKSIHAFYQHPIDLLITNIIPHFLSLYIINSFLPISYYQLNLISIYKIYIEISGHTGKKTSPTCSFPQFVWLPKLLGIELYTEDHDLHHSKNNCNYSKRFSLWDKIFQTYKQF